MRREDRKLYTIEEIEAIIKKADFCWVALVDGQLPHIVTLNFR